MIKLSASQAKIVSSPIGVPMQVLASAGSGKTRVLTERVRYILENTRKDGIIALTFTNKAAEEMLSRLDDIDGVEDRCWIATIHAVAQRILNQYGYSIGLPSELHIFERDQDRKAIFLQSLRDNGIDVDSFLNASDERTRKDREKRIQSFMEQFSIVKRELLTEEEISDKYPESTRFLKTYNAYQESLLRSHGIDFDDILVYAHRVLINQPWCAQIYRAKYKHICVDEAQDLNRAQYEFIKALCGDEFKSVMMVGDPNQMIYGFNGSSHKFLCKEFISDFSPIQYVLNENYRSSKAVIELANHLKPGSQVEGNYACTGISSLIKANDEEAEATWITNKIQRLITTKSHDDIEGDIVLDKMVVIARNRFVFQALETSLQESNIPYSLKKGERQEEPTSIFGKVLDLAIRLRLNPHDWVDGKKLCGVLKIQPPINWGDNDLLLSFADQISNSAIYYPSIQARLLRSIHGIDIDNPNVLKLCSDYSLSFQECIANDNTSEIDELERSLQELSFFQGCWTNFRKKGLGENLSSFRNAMALGQLSNDSSSSGLTLSTVHTMKGLEKDIVFLMGLCEGVFPDYRAISEIEIDEERNNAFVAITRSRRWLFITYPLSRKMPWGGSRQQFPSRFINEMFPKGAPA